MLTRQILHNLPHLKSTAITGRASSPVPSCAHQGQFGNSTTLRQPYPYPPTTVLSSVFILFIFCSPGNLFLLPAKENFNSPYKERLGSNNRSEGYIIQLFEKKRKTPNATLSLQSALGKMGKKMFKVKFCRQMQKPKADYQQLLQQNVVNSHSDPCPNPTNFMYIKILVRVRDAATTTEAKK